MLIKVLEFLLSSASYIYSFWQKLRQKQQIESEIKQEQQNADNKAITNAAKIRTDSTNDVSLLLRPEDRST